jgi:tetratricopeptide (TPR) repeat protein
MPEDSAHPSAPNRRRGRRRGVEIRPGSVKQARAESGLSLGQIARADISRTAIYFVETGKAKPSIETLRLIAERTNKPLEFFLGPAGAITADPEAALAEIERLLMVGEPAAAAEAAEQLIDATPDARVKAHARVHLSLAHIRVGQPVRARSDAAAARAYFEQVKDLLMAAEAMGNEAGAAGLMLDPSAASLAEEALAMCRTLNPVPSTTEARLLFILGNAYLSRHEYAKAIQTLEASVATASSIQDLRRLSMVYMNLSLSYQEVGRLAEAARYAHRAIAIHETLREKRMLAGAENNLALLLYMQGDLANAFRHAEVALRLSEELGIEVGRAHVLMTLAELELARSNHQAASRHATAALDLAGRLGETANVAEAHMWLGRILEAQGDSRAADAEFTAAFEVLDQVDVPERKTRNRAVYAEILEGRGDIAGANRQLKLALAAMGNRGVPIGVAWTATA